MYNSSLWEKKTRIVSGEPGLFKSSAPVRLLFAAEEVLKVYNPTLQTEYLPGLHFTHTPGSDLIYPVPGSGICGIDEKELFPDPEKALCLPDPNANAIKGGPDGKLLLFDNKAFFAGHQILVDYRAVPGSIFPELPAPDASQLPRVRQKLAEGAPLTVTLIGDSISEGFNATKFVNVPPFAPPYIDIFAEVLREKSGSEITVRNAAIAGTGSRNAFEIEERWLTPPCDLLVIAYGMNELGGVPVKDHTANLCTIMEKKRALHSHTEFLLVTSMTRNPIWLGESAQRSLEFAQAVKSLAAPGCAVADLHALWTRILEKKDFYDLTGNGVNHPNDYGHRLYSAVLVNIFN